MSHISGFHKIVQTSARRPSQRSGGCKKGTHEFTELLISLANSARSKDLTDLRCVLGERDSH